MRPYRRLFYPKVGAQKGCPPWTRSLCSVRTGRPATLEALASYCEISWVRIGSSGFRDVEVGVAQLEGPLGTVLGPGLDEVELIFIELQVGAVGVKDIGGGLLP